jgi:hypothetical protein
MYDIRIKDEEHQRCSAENVREWIRQGLINGHTLLREHGTEDYKPLSSFSEFQSDLSKGADPPPTPEEKIKRLSNDALYLGIASLLCGLTAIPAIVQSIRGIILMRKHGSGKTTRAKVAFGLIFPSCLIAFVIFSILAAYLAARSEAREINCVNNMKELTLSIFEYENKNNDLLPPVNQWCDALQATNLAMFHCPEAPKGQRCSYAMNQNLAGIKNTGDILPDTVVLFESDAGWNASGGPEIAVARHLSRLTVTFMDGSVSMIDFKNLGSLRWNPFTNSAPSIVH